MGSVSGMVTEGGAHRSGAAPERRQKGGGIAAAFPRQQRLQQAEVADDSGGDVLQYEADEGE
jgi:hypothetical protein